jgi:hypothetical protein
MQIVRQHIAAIPEHVDNSPLLINEVQIRQDVFDWLLEGCSVSKIQQLLTDKYSPRGKAWHRTTVQRLVERVRLLGPQGLPDMLAFAEVLQSILFKANATIERHSAEAPSGKGLIELIPLVSALMIMQRCIEQRSTRADEEIMIRALLLGAKKIGTRALIRHPNSRKHEKQQIAQTAQG